MSGKTAEQDIQIVTTISENDKSCVYLAMKPDRKLAIWKILSGNDKTALYRSIQELHSSFLPRIETVAYSDGKTYILEEYIEGTGLDELLEGRIDRQDGISYMIQLVQAVNVLHKRNPPLIHRDIKPENIMIKADGQLVLLDFDATREYVPGEKDRDTRMLGTRGYASPEQFGFAQTDVRSDIYSVGIVCTRIAEKMDTSPGLWKKIKRVLDKATMFDPNKRFRNADQMLAALRRIERLVNQGTIGRFRLILLIPVGLALAAVLFLGRKLWQPDTGVERRDYPNVCVWNRGIIPSTYHYTPMKQIWIEQVNRLGLTDNGQTTVRLDTDGADGILENGGESPLGTERLCFRYCKAFPQALLLNHYEFEGRFVDYVSFERYSDGGEQLIETIRIADPELCNIRDGYLCVATEALDILEPGVYLLQVHGKQEWNWTCYLMVHGEADEIDNFVVHAENAIQIYSVSAGNELMFHMWNTPYGIEAVYCNGEKMQDEDYTLFRDARGMILKSDFLEGKAAEDVLELSFQMKNGRMAYGRVYIVP